VWGRVGAKSRRRGEMATGRTCGCGKIQTVMRPLRSDLLEASVAAVYLISVIRDDLLLSHFAT